MSDTDPKPTVLLLTHARTASHVLERMLSKQSNLVQGQDWFATNEARLPRREVIKAGPIEEMDPAILQKLMAELEKGYVDFERFLAYAQQQGKTVLAYTQPHSMLSPKLMSDAIYRGMESTQHGRPGSWVVGPDSEAHTNPTVVPDSILLRPGTVPIINFRHPLLIVDGIFRGLRNLPAFADDAITDKMIALNGNVRWQRLMYEWYVEHGKPHGIEPILVDADDYTGPAKESLMQKICDRVPGFDADKVAYSWPKATAEEVAALPEHYQQALQTILASDGVKSGYDMRSRDVEATMAEWKTKAGQEYADKLKELVDRAMPDYDFLMAHRLRPDESS